MPKPRGVSGDVLRLELSEGDWIEVKRELTIAELRDVPSEARIGTAPDGRPLHHERKLTIGAVAQYLVNWSFVDRLGRPMIWPGNGPLAKKIEVLGALDRPTFEEVETAIGEHYEREKNAQARPTGGNGSDPSSPSAAPPDGDTATS